MWVNDEHEKHIVERVKYEANQILIAVEDNIKKRLSVAEQKAQEILRNGEAVYVDLLAQRKAQEILAKAKVNAIKQMETTLNEAEAKAKDREQEDQSDKSEDIRSQILLEAKNKIIEHTDSIISEAEQTAFSIINEAKKRANDGMDFEFENRSGIRSVTDKAIEQEPDAPNLSAELRKRYAEITFGEPQIKQYSSRSTENVDSSTIEFNVFAGAQKEQIGKYSVRRESGGIVGKTYEHWGKLLMIRGEVSDWEYQYLQQLADKGQIQGAFKNSLRIGVRNYVVYNFPVFIWSAAYGREDRFTHDVKFP